MRHASLIERRRLAWVVAAAMLLSGAATAGSLEDALAAARGEVAEGRCQQVGARLAGIEGLASRAALLEGQCWIRRGSYPEALESLRRARGAADLSPEQVGDVELYRAVALYHLERYGEASTALDAAEGLSRETAQLALYRGLLSLRRGDNDRAAPDLEDAARLSPRLTEPVASYYAGLAWQGATQRNRAREAFRRVIAVDGDGAWGKEAQKLLDSMERFPYFVRGSVGIEWDSNVLLRGDVSQVAFPGDSPLTIAGEDDWRGVWELDGGVELWQSADATLSAGLTGSYLGDAQAELSDVNTHYPTVGAFLARRFGPNTTGQVRYQFGHAWVDEDPYLQSHLAEVSVSHTWTRAGTTILLVDMLANDLRFETPDVEDGPGTVGAFCDPRLGVSCGPPGIDESKERNRDGIGAGAAVQHRFFLPVPRIAEGIVEEIQVAGGYRLRYYDSEGDEWTYWSNLLNIGTSVELPLDTRVVLRFSYERRDFAHPSTFPDTETVDLEYGLSSNDREENEFLFEGELEKDLSDHWSVSARYSYLDNDSNRDAYHYDRHIVGGYLNFRFD